MYKRQHFQPRSQGLSSLPPLVVGTETLVAAGHVTTQNLGGRKICWKGGQQGSILSSSRPNVLQYPPTLRFWMDRWSRDQPRPGSLFQPLREAEKRDPGNEVGSLSVQTHAIRTQNHRIPRLRLPGRSRGHHKRQSKIMSNYRKTPQSMTKGS